MNEQELTDENNNLKETIRKLRNTVKYMEHELNRFGVLYNPPS